MTDDEPELRREGSIASQVATDTPSVVGSAGGRTLEAIFWSIGETLSQSRNGWAILSLL